MFNTDKRLAIISNVGPLVEPLTKDTYNIGKGRRPAMLFSHNDQSNTWMSFKPEGATVGIVSATRGGRVFEADLAAVAARSIDAETTLRTALKEPSDALFGTAPASGTYNASADPKLQYDNPLTGAKSFSGLAQQLQMVARMIDASSAAGIGAKRQVFFVSLGGFDMHDNENRSHADLMARLAHAMRYFDTTLGAMGARSSLCHHSDGLRSRGCPRRELIRPEVRLHSPIPKSDANKSARGNNIDETACLGRRLMRQERRCTPARHMPVRTSGHAAIATHS